MITTFFGTAQSYASKQALVTKWNLKKSGVSMFQTKGNLTFNASETAQAEQKKQKLNSIKTKLKSGMRLSTQELAYLKENNPQLYQKVMDSYLEREAYKKKLENCKTKDEVSKLQTETLSQLASELSSASSNPNIPEGKKLEIAENIQMRMSALQNEHTSFVGSSGYARLKWEYELDREEKAKEKKAKQNANKIDDDITVKGEEEKPDISGSPPEISEEEASGTTDADNEGDKSATTNDSAKGDDFADLPPAVGNTNPPNTIPSTATPQDKPTHVASTATTPTPQRKAFIARA